MRLTLLIVTLTAQILLHPLSADAREMKIGVILGLTGHAGVWADYARKAIELAASDFDALPNQRTTLELVFEDSKSTSAGAVSAFNKLVHQNKVAVVVGDVWGFLTVPLIPLAGRERVVLISPTVMDKSVPLLNEYFFSMGHRFESMQGPVEKFFALHPGATKVGALAYEDDWNQAFVDVVTQAARRAGGEVVKAISVNDLNPDFRAEVTALKRAHVAAVIAGWKAEVALRRMKEQKFHPPFLSSADTVEAFLVRTNDKALLEGAFFVDWPASPEFADKFQARYGSAPLYEAQNSYEVIRAIFKAANSGGSDLRSSLAQLSYDGFEGRIDFSKSQFPNPTEARLYRIEGGVFREQ